MQTAFELWTQGRHVESLGTNFGSSKLPFQGWRHFKEAFAPELIHRAINESKRKVQVVIDPFGGSGTTALASQFLGLEPITIEVNPYLADLIESKLNQYDSVALLKDFTFVIKSAKAVKKHYDLSHLPPTFVHPGVNNRWIYSLEVAQRITAYHSAILKLENENHRKFFRAILGGIAIEVSNVYVNGKGRRYRQNWQAREKCHSDVDNLFAEKVQNALCEIVRYSTRPNSKFTLLRGDARKIICDSPNFDLAVFSPPYPNSFDYTDIYNVELWMLGYLCAPVDNQTLRKSTLTSHVSILRNYSPKPAGSRTLNGVSKQLHKIRSELWNSWIPDMVDGYFFDMKDILESIYSKLRTNGEVWMVVGDSRYAGVHIPVAKILIELSKQLGYSLVSKEAFRSMRASAQQGGRHELEETLVILRK